MAPNCPPNPADILTLCADATWKCVTDFRVDFMQSPQGHRLTPALAELRGRRLDKLAESAIYASQRDALLECLAERRRVQDLTLSLLCAADGSAGVVRHYMLNAAPQFDVREQFQGYIGSLRVWDDVPFAEHRKGEVVELLRQADVALEKEARLRHEGELLLIALQILIEPIALQDKCAKLFEVFGPALAFDQGLILRRGFRARFTVAAASDAEFLGLEWPEDAMPRAVLAGEARLLEGDHLGPLSESLPDPLRTAKSVLFAPLCMGAEVAILVVLGQRPNQFMKQHLSLMQRVSLIATKAFQEEDQKAAVVASSKLAAMGELLATIAHEINQPITIISMSATNGRMMLEDIGGLPDIDTKLERIELQARRAADIIEAVRQLSYVDRLSTGHETLDLREALQAVETIATIGLEQKGITLSVTVDDACPPVQGQSSRLQQVVLNLITNARDAVLDRMAESPTQESGFIRVHAAPVGGHVVLRVSDNGGGVPEDIRDRIFDPFYTLKQMGKGNGLGLALCRRLLADMGGEIRLHNDDQGAVFEISLCPASDGAAQAADAATTLSVTG